MASIALSMFFRSLSAAFQSCFSIGSSLEGSGVGFSGFEICPWISNQSKSCMTSDQFVDFCRKVISFRDKGAPQRQRARNQTRTIKKFLFVVFFRPVFKRRLQLRDRFFTSSNSRGFMPAEVIRRIFQDRNGFVEFLD